MTTKPPKGMRANSVTMEIDVQFLEYVYGFYGKDTGIYAKDHDGGYTIVEIAHAIQAYMHNLPTSDTYGNGDSIDRERVRDYLRLEYLRGEIEKECISYGEIAELQGLAGIIDKNDVQLLQWAGVPEHTN